MNPRIFQQFKKEHKFIALFNTLLEKKVFLIEVLILTYYSTCILQYAKCGYT
jgi:hypothetical protein